MNPRFAATIALQRPAEYRDPASLLVRDVCPHCKRQTTVYRFGVADKTVIETHHCAEHGDVAPMRSHVANYG